MVRLLSPEDHTQYRRIRLLALATDPLVFGSNHARESAWPESRWATRLADPNLGVFGVFDGDQLLGMTGIGIWDQDPNTGVLWGSWLHPDIRGRGLSRPMYEVRLQWAHEKQLARVVVAHRASNVASMRANQHFGFRRTHTVSHTWPDGAVEDEVHYELLSRFVPLSGNPGASG